MSLDLHGPQLHREEIDGVTVIVIEERSLPMVNFGVAFRSGADGDPDGGAGLTHAALELLLRGTERRSREEFSNSLEELGSSVYPAVRTELSVLRGSCLTRQLEATWALATEALFEPVFAPDEVSRFVSETIDDLRSARDDDGTVAELFLRKRLFDGHRFARSPAGEVADLSTLEPNALRARHDSLLTRSNVLFLFAGDIDMREAEALVRPNIATLPEGPKPAPAPTPTTNDKLRFLVVDKPERSQAQLRMARLACGGHNPDSLAFWLGATSFGGTFTAPFTREVRDKRGWSYTASADYDRMTPYRGALVMRTAPAKDDAVDCAALQLELYADLAQGKLEREIITFAQSYLLNRYPFYVATAADMLMPALRHEILGRDPVELLTLPERLEKITPQQVVNAVRANLVPASLEVVLVATAKDVQDSLGKRFPSAQIDVVDFRDGLNMEDS